MAALPPLRYTGAANFRQRLALSTLSGRRVVITGIRSQATSPGLREHEATFLRLLDKLTNGSSIEINETGTSLRYSPGFLTGGALEHECGGSRSVGWYLEGVLPLAPFGKKALALTLRGVTNDDVDFGVDTLKHLHLAAMAHFGVKEGLELELVRRGCPPAGGGEARFTCPAVRELKAINFVEEGYVKRVRGVAFACRVSPLVANRIVDGVRGILNNFLPDVFITTDARGGGAAGASPGYGCQLLATTTSGCAFASQRAAGCARGTDRGAAAAAAAAPPPAPEDIGREVASALLDEIKRGGCVDSLAQPLALTLMALCPQNVSRLRLGKLSPAAIDTLRLLRDFLGCTFKLTPQAAGSGSEGSGSGSGSSGSSSSSSSSAGGKKRSRGAEGEEGSGGGGGGGGGGAEDTIIASCLGIGYKNNAKRVT